MFVRLFVTILSKIICYHCSFLVFEKLTRYQRMVLEMEIDFIKQVLRNRLIFLRLQSRYTQQEVAQMLGICRTAYLYYESGRSLPSISRLFQIAQIYGISVSEIMRGLF